MRLTLGPKRAETVTFPVILKLPSQGDSTVDLPTLA